MKNRKISGAAVLLLLLFGTALSAARYEKLGGYLDVEVLDVTWRGIEIVHRDGTCRLTDEDLSAEDKELLKDELEKLHTLQAEQQKLWKARQEQLAKEKKIADQQARSVNNVMNQARKNKNLDNRIKMLLDARKKYPKASNMAALNKMIVTQQAVAVTGAMNRAKKRGKSEQTPEHPPQRPETLPLRLQPGRAQAAHQQNPQRQAGGRREGEKSGRGRQEKTAVICGGTRCPQQPRRRLL